MPNRKKTNAQVRRMFGLAKPLAAYCGMEMLEYLRDRAFEATRERTASIADLTFDEANTIIKLLGGDPFPAYGNSKRSENHRKQQAGIKSIETEPHLKKIADTAAKLGWDDERLRGFCQRQIKRDHPTTTEEGNKVLEGLKAMAKRTDNVAQFPKSKTGPQAPSPASSEPKFRRVA